MHWRGAQLYAVQPTSVEHQQVGAALGSHCLPAESTSTMSIQDWVRHHHSVNVCALCRILAFILTLISACRCMSSNLSRVASQFCVSYAAFEDLSRHLCISRWSLHLSYRDWTTEMRHWPVFRPACSTVSNPSSTRQVGRSLVPVARCISPVSTGFDHSSASSSNWRSFLLRSSRHLSGQLRYVADLRLSTSILLDVHDSGTVYLSTSSLPCHLQHFVWNWKYIYFGSLNQTLKLLLLMSL